MIRTIQPHNPKRKVKLLLKMCRHLKSVLCLIIAICLAKGILAQDELKRYVNTMPPNVASFEKYGNVPVTYNTGQVAQVIPLYTFPVDANLEIPFLLTYSNNGLKPDDIPSWVGHGWDLTPVGYIVQDIKGIDDISVNGLAHTNTKQMLEDFKSGSYTPEQRYAFLKDASRGFVDSQQDIFSLNILGRSTKFYFDGTTVKFLKFAPYRIILTSSQTFEVTDEKGYKFLFESKTACSGGGGDDPSHSNAQGGSVTWSLTRIVLPDASEISITYQSDAGYGLNNSSKVYTSGVIGFSQTQPITTVADYAISNATSGMIQQVIQRLSYKGRSIEFNTFVRLDLYVGSAVVPHGLSNIIVRDENNNVVKKIQFGYNNGTRLRLDKVAFLDNVADAEVDKYVFEYGQYQGVSLTDIPLPTSSSRTYAIDHWGYYNYQLNNTFAGVPRAKYGQFVPPLGDVPVGDNNRDPNGDASQIGILKKITYPTGGYSEFEYEPNRMTTTSVTGITPYMVNDIMNTVAQVPGADDYVQCPGLEGVNGVHNGTFTISEGFNTRIEWSFSSTPYDNNDICSILITGSDGSTFQKFGLTQGTYDLRYLNPGTYNYTLQVGCASAQAGDNNFAQFSIKKFLPLDETGLIYLQVGGNRIKRIKTRDAATSEPKVHRLEYRQSEFFQYPQYVSQKEMITTQCGVAVDQPTYCGSYGTQYTISAYNLASWEGGVVYYNQVTEYDGEDGENGKTVYSYPTQFRYSDDYLHSPFPDVTSLSWRTGDKSKIDVYKKAASDYSLVQKSETFYTPAPLDADRSQWTRGVKVGVVGYIMYGPETPYYYTNFYNQAQVYLPVDKYAKSKEIMTQYASDGTQLSKTTEFAYDDTYFQMIKKTDANSKGDVIEKKIWYPSDYSSSVANVSTLLTNNMVGLPVKTIMTNNGRIVEGAIYDLDNNGNTTKVYQWEDKGELAAMPVHNASNLYITGFNPHVELAYNAGRNLREYHKSGSASTAILWGYNNTYPIAKVQNASYQDLVAVLGQTTIDQLQGNSPGTDATVRATLNQLRTDSRLAKSLVTTYTYSPLLGMSSETDPAGRTTYYEYDNYSRLKLIRDQDNKIVKQYSYKLNNRGGAETVDFVFGNDFWNFGTFNVTLTNVNTGTQYTYNSLPIHFNGVLGKVPKGTYNVSVSNNENFVFAANICGVFLVGSQLTFYNINPSSCNILYVEGWGD